MKMFKKIAFVMLFVAMVFTPVMAQVAADPNESYGFMGFRIAKSR